MYVVVAILVGRLKLRVETVLQPLRRQSRGGRTHSVENLVVRRAHVGGHSGAQPQRDHGWRRRRRRRRRSWRRRRQDHRGGGRRRRKHIGNASEVSYATVGAVGAQGAKAVG
eukprot:scaffold11885_cov129-Isochrysis_galbana.AAC.5